MHRECDLVCGESGCEGIQSVYGSVCFDVLPVQTVYTVRVRQHCYVQHHGRTQPCEARIRLLKESAVNTCSM
jgi:hypothetical protein